MKLMPAHDRAHQFCTAFDEGDTSRLLELLAPDSVYHKGDRVIAGREEIVQTFASGMTRAQTLFDTVTFESTVVEVGDDMAIVEFTDILRREGRTYRYHTQQRLMFDAEFSIVQIDEIAIPGEREGLVSFMAALGIEMPGPTSTPQP